MAEPGRFRRTLSRWASSAEQEEHDLRSTYAERTEVSIADAPNRDMVTLRGSLHTVTLRPRGGVPALEAELADGSGALMLVWLGRRRIVGIDPGVAIQVSGRIGVHNGVRIMYNPRYELIPGRLP